MSILDSSPDEPDSDPSPESQSPLNQWLDQHEQLKPPQLKVDAPLRMVETAFLASTASLIWFINFYFPLGPVLRIFFPVPIALVYLRWGKRAAWMSALTSGFCYQYSWDQSAVTFVMPYGFMGVLLGATWYRRGSLDCFHSLGTLLGTLGVFFRLWLLSVLSR